MERIDRILNHVFFQESMAKTEAFEKDRAYCRHDLGHCLDVARIAYLYCLEQGIPISKDMIYGAALLHDIGRFRQYETASSHALESAKAAPEILKDCGYRESEIEEIVRAIACHNSFQEGSEENLTKILYWADKKSRLCFQCKARESCNWPEEKKNKTCIY